MACFVSRLFKEYLQSLELEDTNDTSDLSQQFTATFTVHRSSCNILLLATLHIYCS